ncbi:MAG: transcriptional regulator NrdR [Chloroflexota bacterium]|nr:transcriptional regulator NrdR [Chloroflexota bacterium]
MKCPYCRADDSRVVDSRELSGGNSIRRRRECMRCRRRFTTYERIEGTGLMVVKKDGRRQEFDPVKLRQKLRVALTKRPIGEAQIDAMLQRIEADLLSLGTTEVPSSAIGEAVLRELKQLDEVAYIRFASVYRQFADIDEFHREMEDLRERPAPHPLTRGRPGVGEGDQAEG